MDLTTLISMGINLILGVIVFVFGQKWLTAKGKFAKAMDLLDYIKVSLEDEKITSDEAQMIADLFNKILQD